ncbi:MAG: hypothetical protein LC803_22585 [Acidobacteria bacterium]|nr:hypothetical protein [Acidobacteriota bacterium]
MPLALLLQELREKFLRGAKEGGFHLNDWDRLVELEALLVARAQSAFLIQWFGPHLPLHGFHVRVAIDNFDALRARYQQITSSTVQAREGPNLTEPLAGMVGTLFGSLSTPITSLFLYQNIRRLMPTWYTGLAAALNAITFGLLGSFIGLLAAPAPIAFLPAAFTSGDTVLVYNLLGAVAQMARPFQRFWQVISGPREEVQNPVLRGMLMLGDQLAQLFPYLIALMAIVLTQVGRVMRAIRIQFPLIQGLVSAVKDVIVFVFEDFFARLRGLYEGRNSVFGILSIVFGALRMLMPMLTRALNTVLRLATDELRRIGDGMMNVVAAWTVLAMPFITAATSEHPFVTTLKAFSRTMDALKGMYASTAPTTTTPSSPGIFSRLAALVIPPFPSLSTVEPDSAAVTRGAGGSPPPLSVITPLTELFQGIREQIPGLLPNPLALSEEARRGLVAARNPPSVFAGEMRALEARRARPLAEALVEQNLRDLLFEVVARVLPPSVYESIAGLEPVFVAIDDYLGREHPVRDLPESDRLQPVVSRLRVRARAASEASVRAWAEDLRNALGAQTYTAPVRT